MTRLHQEPRAHPRTVQEMMSLAAALEGEAAARYEQLAAAMTGRGEHGLAATFKAMLEEERDHLAAIERWSRELTGAAPAVAAASWVLPPEIADSWDEALASALLTPYKALGIAVLNEERGFAFYSYLAAHADTDAVRGAAERLAREELGHAALLRRERRRAYRRERRQGSAGSLTDADAHGSAGDRERNAAVLHALIAERLKALGETEDAAALTAVADDEIRAAAALDAPAADPARTGTVGRQIAGRDRIDLLRAGLAESERLYDMYADAVDRAGTEPMLRAAQRGAGRVVDHLGRIAARLHRPAP